MTKTRNAQGKSGRKQNRQQLGRSLPYRPEINYVDISLSGATPNYSGQWQTASIIAPGDNDQQRQGNLVSPVSFTLNAVFARGAADAVLRFLVVQLLYDEANVAATDPLETTASALVISSHHNRDFVAPGSQAARMVIFYDETISLDTYHPVHMRTLVIDHARMRQKYMRYLDSAATNLPVCGSLGYFVYSNLNASLPAWNAITRVEYLDA